MSKYVTIRYRMIAAAVFLAVAAIFAFLWAGATGRMETSRYLGICGFKQSYALPCPTCFTTHAAQAFVRGHIIEAFYIQPAGALLCCLMLASAVFALLIAVFGVHFPFLHQRLSWRTVKYCIVSAIIITGAGWAVTLARTLARGR